MTILRMILGDQLNHNHTWYDRCDDNVVYAMFEMNQELTYVNHHIQKIIGFFLSMRNFKKHLEANGHKVEYFTLDDPRNTQSLEDNLKYLIQEYGVDKFEYQLPDEFRLDNQLKLFCEEIDLTTEAFDTEHFFTTRYELKEFFKGKKSYLMESFYRAMRKKHKVLMNGNDPVTGKWNYDASNRKKLPKGIKIPEPKVFVKNVKEVMDMVEKRGVKYIGRVDVDNFYWPVSRDENLELLNHFTHNLLIKFGDYQDSMTQEDWSLFHARLSFGLNTKQISPREVIDTAIDKWRNSEDSIDISQIEGFVRQIIGWREYMRGVYWAHMPEYEGLNYFDNDLDLPSWFWNGNTNMNCLQHSIGQSLDFAYAHHIQRLMVIGNFLLIAGIHPDQVDQWYLGIYIDAIQWVEITNTRGMSQFADGGIVGTKPYVSSANYISKMSDYCSNCYYNQKEKFGDKACPFNTLYWNFYDRNRSKLENNPRIGMMYRVWDKMDAEERTKILVKAKELLDGIEVL